MARPNYAQAVDEIQDALRPLLKARGFKVRGRTFNGVTEDGLTRVVSIQMGTADPPGTTHIPGLRENLHGLFTVNLGVYVVEIAETLGIIAPRTVDQSRCQIRNRLGQAAGAERDVWWSLGEPVVPVLNEVSRLLLTSGTAFVEEFATRDAIVQDWIRKADERHLSRRARVDVAIILARRGELSAARRLLEEQIAGSTDVPRHVEHVRNLARQLGLGELT